MNGDVNADAGLGEATGDNIAKQGLHVVAKPVGPACNLDCTYCFYLEKQALFPSGTSMRMSDSVLRSFIEGYIVSQPTSEVEFVWQGGCPKHRFARTSDNTFGLQYLCPGYKKFFLHIRTYLHLMTRLLENNLPVSMVMDALNGPLAVSLSSDSSRR